MAGIKIDVHHTLGRFCHCLNNSSTSCAVALVFGLRTTNTGESGVDCTSLKPGCQHSKLDKSVGSSPNSPAL